MLIFLGCFFWLFVWGVASFLYYLILGALTTPIPPENHWWLALLFGLGVTIVLGQIYNIFKGIRKIFISGRDQNSWEDGELVGISGRVQCVGGGITSPVSGKQCAVIEFTIREGATVNRSQNSSSAALSLYNGFQMAPCGVQSMRGFVRFHGFPMLHHFRRRYYREKSHLLAIAEFLSNTELTPLPKNPLDAIRSLTDVLKDDDGELTKVFARDSSSFLKPPSKDALQEVPLSQTPNVTSPEAENDEYDDEEGPENWDSESYSSVEEFATALEAARCSVEEQAIEIGEEVVAFGTYRKDQRAVDIGGGLGNLSHSIQSGTMQGVLFGNIIRSFLGLVFWVGALVAANYFSFPQITEEKDLAISKICELPLADQLSLPFCGEPVNETRNINNETSSNL